MNRTRRGGTVSVGALVGLGVALGLLHGLAPRWVQSVGLDVWNLPTLREDLRESREHTDVVDQRRRQIQHEIELADHVTARLIDGTLTLAQATDQLEPVMRHRDGFDTAWRLTYRTPTFRHGVARYAIRRVEDRLRNEPERSAAVCAPLEAQYAGLKD